MIVGDRGGKVLIHNDNKFQKNKQRTNNIYWRCRKKTFRASVTNAFDIDDPEAIINVKRESIHNHVPQEDMIDKQDFVNTVKNIMATDPTIPVRRVYNEVVTQRNEEGEARMAPRFTSTASQLRRRRAIGLPPIPANVQDVVIDGIWAETWDHTPYLFYQDDNIAIATEQYLELMQRCPTLYINGTFRTSPHPYIQFVTIHGYHIDRVLTLACVLLPDKERVTPSTLP